jgi:hypothetical protein
MSTEAAVEVPDLGTLNVPDELHPIPAAVHRPLILPGSSHRFQSEGSEIVAWTCSETNTLDWVNIRDFVDDSDALSYTGEISNQNELVCSLQTIYRMIPCTHWLIS